MVDAHGQRSKVQRIPRLIAAMFLLACCIAQATAPGSLGERARALRALLGPASESVAEDRAGFLRRQLLASLERRIDMERAIQDVANLGKHPPAARAPAPTGLLAIDDQRREVQRLEAELTGGERRRAILLLERAQVAKQLADSAAHQRALVDQRAPSADIELASLESELTESATAEIDLMVRLVDVQQDLARRERDALARKLVESSAKDVVVTERDAATIDARLRARGAELRRRMASAAASRERLRAELLAAPSDAPPLRIETMKERIANADIDLELGREGLLNLATEQLAWQVALRFYRDKDPQAIVEARENGPPLAERLQRRREFLQQLSEQVLARSGTLTTELTQAPNAPDAADRRALRDVFDQRLHMIERAAFDERQLEQLVARIRTDFDARVGIATWPERLRLGWATVRAAGSQLWNFELFTVQQSIEVDGRKTQVPRGVTIGKVIKAPLLLLLGLWLAVKATALGERWLHRRRGVDEGRARLMRRWALALLVAAAVLASLILAGIPLAAFAFIGGAVAIGIGFGMQALFKNLISGVLVLVERPFRLGDVIEVGTLRGTVVDIDLRTSVVRDADGADTLIPNSVLMEENVKNVTFRSRVHRQMLDVVVDGASDPRAVSDAMRDAAARHGQLADDPEPVVLLEAFADNGLRFVLHYWIELTPGTDRRRIASDLRLMILGAFEDAGIRMAPPPPRLG